jgi:DNA-binding XRE family transcriptional regulator
MNIATILKSEISRIAKKEVRSELQSLKKSSAAYRSDIAALKRRVAELEKIVKQLGKVTGGKSVVKASTETAGKIRFSAKGFAALRKKLGLSSAQMGVLIGVSDQSVYKYEKGEVQPRAATVVAIAGLRGLGKRAVGEKLAQRK